MTTVRIPRDWCPVCDALLSAATSVGGNFTPRPGDLTVCIQCGVILTFTDDLRHEITTQEVIDSLDQNELAKLHQALRERTNGPE